VLSECQTPYNYGIFKSSCLLFAIFVSPLFEDNRLPSDNIFRMEHKKKNGELMDYFSIFI